MTGETVTPDEQLDNLAAELDSLKREYPNTLGILRLTNNSLRACSKWKWEQHGWSGISDGDVCGIMNGHEKDRRTALLSILEGNGIHKIEFVSDVDVLKVVPDRVSHNESTETICVS
jgi:hypothetical protein